MFIIFLMGSGWFFCFLEIGAEFNIKNKTKVEGVRPPGASEKLINLNSPYGVILISSKLIS